jgi:ATP phosphoribosyltransferase
LTYRICRGGVFISRVGGKIIAIARNADVVGDVLSGEADFGLLGSDMWGELPSSDTRRLRFDPVAKLAGRFALAAPPGVFLGESDRIATSYPLAWTEFAVVTGARCQLGRVMKGKVETAIARGMAEGIYEIVETGASLRDNGLEIQQEGPALELGGLWRAECSTIPITEL